MRMGAVMLPFIKKLVIMNRKEIWMPVEDYIGLYEVSNMGRVRSLNYNREGRVQVLVLQKGRNGYMYIELNKNTVAKRVLVHRLVAKAFIPNPENLPVVNHKNEQKDDNRVENLEWCTIGYNANYGTRGKRIATTRGRKISQYNLSGELINTYESVAKAQRDTGFRNLWNAASGKLKTVGGYRWTFT